MAAGTPPCPWWPAWEYLVLWLDCDAEGENIGFEVIALTQQHIAFDNVYRARFSAVTAPEVKAAFQELSQPDKYAALAVDARQELGQPVARTAVVILGGMLASEHT